MYSQALRAEITAACTDFSKLTPKCLAALSKMETQIGNFDGMFWTYCAVYYAVFFFTCCVKFPLT